MIFKKKVRDLDLKERRTFVEPDASMTIARQCALLDLERSTFYYKTRLSQESTEVMNAIADIHKDYPFYGYRKIEVLLEQEGFIINHKRLKRIMKSMGIFAIYPKPKTSIKNNSQTTYEYLLKGLDIHYPNQVWSIDITYISTERGVVYLFALLDWYSRYVVGWTLATTMEAQHAIETFGEALRFGSPEIVNSDQGSQFTSQEWVQCVLEYGAQLSHTGCGRCIDNVRIERLWRSIKYENIHLRSYDSIRDLRAGIKDYLNFYNHQRPHQALGYKTPADFFILA